MSKPAGRPPRTIHRTFKAAVDDVDEKKRQIRSVVTTDAIDRYQEVILPKGIQLANFERNPVVLWQHRSDTPIGRCLSIKRKNNGLVAVTEFAENDDALKIFGLYAGGFLNGWSIGARPDWRHYTAPTEAEIKERPELKGCYAVIRKCELVEYSAVSIPANADALGNEVVKSLSEDLRREIEESQGWDEARIPDAEELLLRSLAEAEPKIELPPLVGRNFAEVVNQVRRDVGILVNPALAQRMIRDEVTRLKGGL